MDVDYRVTWSVPGEDLHLTIVAERAGTPIFAAGLALEREPLDRPHAITALLRYPLMPLRVSAAIYREALRLFAKRVPFYRHPGRDPR